MKNVCIITASRSEYGLLRWVIDEVFNSDDFELQLVVTGAHLVSEQGYTYKMIEEDGYPIIAKVDMNLDTSTKESIVKSMGVCSIGFAQTFATLNPDIVIVLGDRYELLPICSAALVMNIPIAHIAGGEITKGAIDDQVRNAITMMSSLHFPNGKYAFENVVRMLNSRESVFDVGEPCIENYQRLHLKSRSDIAKEYGFDINKKWILVTLHAETNLSLKENLEMAGSMLEVLKTYKNSEIIITGSNSDYGGSQFNHLFMKVSSDYENMHFYVSLGQINYLSCMNESYCVIGNSSSGVIETPYLGVPTVNIGNRQTGRYIAANVKCADSNYESILSSLESVTFTERYLPDYSFGDGKTSKHILTHLKHFLHEGN